ncbi:hydroxysqualene dehydroxylase HpnE [Pelomonas sp. SE-A7]|nr:hydroxysqualene dehydroxylase HpnE [Pelomonas sp. SE-A7]MDM4767427.1 hydroxysqualene dehydroxylase HpnE [Pelomonas sp. SE-A7]
MAAVRPRVAVIGGGWAGLAAAVRACELGAQVALFEMAAQLGGRARSVSERDPGLDNGQHILIGAYCDTLSLMRHVGADPDKLLLRTPLRLRYPDHEGLRLPGGQPLLSFLRGVLSYGNWPWSARWRLLAQSTIWLAKGFQCEPELSVADLCAGLPRPVLKDLVEPLCVAALNTPADQASGQVFLRVLRDALFSGPGSADLLLPRKPLGDLLPEPAAAWLNAHDATLKLGSRVQALETMSDGSWRVDGERFDAVLLACPPMEAARLAAAVAPAWAEQALALRYEPIVTVYLRCEGQSLPAPMIALHESPSAPAQFAFDHGQLSGQPGLFAFVISGARPWVEAGLDATTQAVETQAKTCFGWNGAIERVRTLAEKRATFACTPGLLRPAAAIAPGLWAAGDYVAGPYPATLEGAVRSGLAAATAAVSPCKTMGKSHTIAA